MAIEKLTEFAKTGQKNTDDLNLEIGFVVNRKPARQWFNWLFNTLTLKINEIINADFMPKSDVVDNLTTNDATKPVSAKQAKVLQDNKLDKEGNAVSATKFANARTISFSGAATGSFNFDGSSNASAILTLANTGVAANTYGSNLKIPVLTVNSKGLITVVSEQTIPSASPTQAGVMKLNNTLTSTRTDEAATAAQAKVLNDQAFGVGQTWQDVTSSRVKNTTYTNTSGKAIQVCISLPDANNANPTVTINVNGTNIIQQNYDSGSFFGSTNLTFVVPNNQTYSVNTTNGGNIGLWAELR